MKADAIITLQAGHIFSFKGFFKESNKSFFYDSPSSERNIKANAAMKKRPQQIRLFVVRDLIPLLRRMFQAT